MNSLLIDARALAVELSSAEPPVVLDVRYRLDAPDGSAAYRAGHVPGAIYVSLDEELAAHGAPEEGRHPLPSPEAFQRAVQRWGIDDGDRVVVYDDWNSFAAARAWWMLSDGGVDVRVLDGGLRAWRDSGGALEEGDVEVAPGTATLTPGHRARLDIDAAAELAQTGVLLDARAPERYRGEVEPLDPAAGHIPGARNAPTTENLAAGAGLLSAGELREKYEELDGETIGVYCGSGVTAAHAVLALAIAGHEAALYPGSWSQWSNTPDRPVATGDGA
ncbi:sulfurtransferase [Microbacterium sp. VKM Ac-2870]|uniref:sulfurtransferase n=1 Tax=Microbacterium sp. VKM Ac-2870 TaxID=2783825 RepID=UPI00188B68A3|nr:sulfurtransferase [Microbacterium sp. VKM Ac-2870]MBF4562095.1 sulfurtransferase [Microbacterium sp. VKM Ac-2870]